MTAETVIRPYNGPQPARLALIEGVVTQMIGKIEVIDGRQHKLVCVIVDRREAPNYITEVHFQPVEAAALH